MLGRLGRCSEELQQRAGPDQLENKMEAERNWKASFSTGLNQQMGNQEVE